jgi:hypothetical protein
MSIDKNSKINSELGALNGSPSGGLGVTKGKGQDDITIPGDSKKAQNENFIKMMVEKDKELEAMRAKQKELEARLKKSKAVGVAGEGNCCATCNIF